MTFLDLFGNSRTTRIMDLLGDHPTSSLTLAEIADALVMYYEFWQEDLAALCRHQLVVSEGVGAKAKYRLNNDHPLVRSVLAEDLQRSRPRGTHSVPR